ncbi:cytochrome c oxidase subunit 6A2, mitochondrial-like [Xenia sp. Carnegie-2017]|uniref:cytochrome c oxidase subunit 6A2, mitochondrial-like n=1 Tax=Xenia sp. Carnegie-2017 TaxID=2897299 RepID=UPI001F03E2BB|nr:cytochrome c oxidase subunit 6A2, mitochondrial-like [Xenia sp. Carnegie-2017]
MASVSRIFSRLLQRRSFSTASVSDLKSEMLAEEKHAAGTTKTWKLISIFVAAPGILFCVYNTVSKEMAHKAHHEKAEFKGYAHLRIRSKPFPWGDGNHTLFHNSHVNALPDGYEED